MTSHVLCNMGRRSQRLLILTIERRIEQNLTGRSKKKEKKICDPNICEGYLSYIMLLTLS